MKENLDRVRQFGLAVPPHVEIKLLGRRLVSLVQQVVGGSDHATVEFANTITPFAYEEHSEEEEEELVTVPSSLHACAPFDPHLPTMSARRCSLAEKLKLVQRILTFEVFASIIADGAESFDMLQSGCDAIHRIYVMGLAKLDPVPEALLVTMVVVEGLMPCTSWTRRSRARASRALSAFTRTEATTRRRRGPRSATFCTRARYIRSA